MCDHGHEANPAPRPTAQSVAITGHQSTKLRSAAVCLEFLAFFLLLLPWHDVGTYDVHTKTGGPNGSIRNEHELGHGANSGLKIAINLCEEVKSKHPKITYADLYQDSLESPEEGRLSDAKQAACQILFCSLRED
ncbi:L-ascorbate peroxidase 3-like isoform X6 [Humulus lupulus]|uniref:L-ascorbate peroxidase 3-like isoform X6 n=1 Tax=Humulus lupulus TaxID=3486 RepID=UPI002B4030FE|nr:L-ascorbate peroxidase 3-like isoform X6 [Humulus lupulus]